MFAFAVWDDAERRLVLARDRWASSRSTISPRRAAGFGSDIHAILARCPARPARSARRGRSTWPTGPVPASVRLLRAIEKLPAAHVLRWHAGVVELAALLDAVGPWRSRSATRTPSRRCASCSATRCACACRSDVPVGSSLSGGVDSSAVVALAGEIAGDHTRHAFTARFPGFERDEWPYAEAVARAAGVVEHHAVEPTGDGLLGELDGLIAGQEEPVVSSSIYAQWCVMRAAERAGVVVLLDGQGGDELFGGYSGMGGYALRSGGPRELLEGVGRGSARELARSLAVDHLPRSLARSYRRRIASPYAAPELVSAASEREPGYEPWMRDADPLRRELLLQGFVTSLPQLLRYADRSSMAHGREVRLPLLDRRVAEFALSLPAAFAFRSPITKRILRDAVRGLVPQAVLDRSDKVGFETPQGGLAERSARAGAHRRVPARPARAGKGPVRTRDVEADVRSGHWRDPGAIWRALNLERWLCLFEDATVSGAHSPLAPAPARG